MTPTYPPAWSYGGITRSVYNITKELSKRGHDVEVWTSDALDLHSRVKSVDVSTVKAGAKVRYFKNLNFTLTRMLNIHVTLDMATSAKRDLWNFDVVHLHGARIFQNVAVYPYAKKYGVPYVLQARGSLPRIMAWQRLKWIYDVLFGYRLLRDALKVIALTRTEAQQYRDMGVPEEKIAIIPNGIDLSEYGNLPPKGSFKKKFSIDDNEKIILYLGRIHRIKGIDTLVKAFASIIEKLKDVKLVVVGPDDGYLSACKKLATQLKVEEKVQFPGALFGIEKLEAYVDADIFALPSRYEIFGNVVLESYACSKPVVATRVGGLQDIVSHGKTGLLIKPGDVKELSSAIFTLLNDDKTRINMGMYARRVVEEKFSLEKMVGMLEATYREVLRR